MQCETHFEWDSGFLGGGALQLHLDQRLQGLSLIDTGYCGAYVDAIERKGLSFIVVVIVVLVETSLRSKREGLT